jgi:hypothetical protein
MMMIIIIIIINNKEHDTCDANDDNDHANGDERGQHVFQV